MPPGLEALRHALQTVWFVEWREFVHHEWATGFSEQVPTGVLWQGGSRFG